MTINESTPPVWDNGSFGALTLALKSILRAIRRRCGWSPMQRVMREIERRSSKPLGLFTALELFAGDGQMHVVDYLDKICELYSEFWDVNAEHCAKLKELLIVGRVRCVNSYEYVRNAIGKFSLIVIDAPPKTYDGHYEVYDLFPYVFNLCAPYQATFILTVAPRLSGELLTAYPTIVIADYVRQRAQFWGITETEAKTLPLTAWDMERAMAKRVVPHGYRLQWSFLQKRNAYVSYFVFHIEKRHG